MDLLKGMKTTMYAYGVMKKHIHGGVNKTIKVGEDMIEFITDDTNTIMYACYCHCSGITRSVYNIYTGYSKWNTTVVDLPIDFALYFTDEDYRFQVGSIYTDSELRFMNGLRLDKELGVDYRVILGVDAIEVLERCGLVELI